MKIGLGRIIFKERRLGVVQITQKLAIAGATLVMLPLEWQFWLVSWLNQKLSEEDKPVLGIELFLTAEVCRAAPDYLARLSSDYGVEICSVHEPWGSTAGGRSIIDKILIARGVLPRWEKIDLPGFMSNLSDCLHRSIPLVVHPDTILAVGVDRFQKDFAGCIVYVENKGYPSDLAFVWDPELILEVISSWPNGTAAWCLDFAYLAARGWAHVEKIKVLVEKAGGLLRNVHYQNFEVVTQIFNFGAVLNWKQRNYRKNLLSGMGNLPLGEFLRIFQQSASSDLLITFELDPRYLGFPLHYPLSRLIPTLKNRAFKVFINRMIREVEFVSNCLGQK